MFCGKKFRKGLTHCVFHRTVAEYGATAAIGRPVHAFVEAEIAAHTRHTMPSVLLICDFVLTLADEADLVRRRKLSAVSAILILNRVAAVMSCAKFAQSWITSVRLRLGWHSSANWRVIFRRKTMICANTTWLKLAF